MLQIRAPYEAGAFGPLRRLVVAALILAGPLSLLFSRIDTKVALVSIGLGAVAGAACIPRVFLGDFLGLSIIAWGVGYAARRIAPALDTIWWQPTTLAVSAMLIVYLSPAAVRRAGSSRASHRTPTAGE